MVAPVPTPEVLSWNSMIPLPTNITTRYASKIVGVGFEAPDQFLANAENWRVHPRDQELALHGSLSEIGWAQFVTVNINSGRMVDGHLRILLAEKEGETAVPVCYVNLTDEEERKALAVLDSIAAMAGTDREKLSTLLGSIQTRDAGLGSLLSSLAQRSVTLDLSSLAGNDGNDVPSSVGGGDEFAAPHDKPQAEPRLASEVLIEIRCSRNDYSEIEDTIAELMEIEGIQVSVV